MKHKRINSYFISAITALLLAFTSAVLPQTLSPAELTAKVNEYMDAAVRVDGFSGSIMIAKDGTPLISKGYGMANIELNVPNGPETVYRLGSITKQFTGLSIAILQERGKLSVDDPICKYFENCPEAWQPIRISHLLAHNSGIPSYTAFPDFTKTTILPTTTSEMLAKLTDKPLDFSPGEKFAYNNSGYYLLGMIVEKVSGKTYEQFLQENIFTPLGMKNTGYDVSARIIPHRAAGYRRQGGKVLNALYMDMTVPFAAGALYSTTGDLLIWNQSFYTEKLASKKTLDAIFDTGGEESAYRYGWNVSKRGGRLAISHGGGIYGFSTQLARYPDAKVTVVVLSNFEGAPSGRVAGALSAIYFGENYEIPQEKTAIEVDAKVLEQYPGKYQIGEQIIVTVTFEDGKLLAQVAGQPKITLLPETEEKFFSKDVNLTITFIKDEGGNVTGFALSQGGANLPAKKIE